MKKADKMPLIWYNLKIKNKFTGGVYVTKIKLPLHPSKKDIEKLKENYFTSKILSYEPSQD